MVDIAALHAALNEAANVLQDIHLKIYRGPEYLELATRWRILASMPCVERVAPAIPVIDESDTVAELRRKLKCAHEELIRRRYRDEELTRYLPAIAARLQSLAEDAAADLRP